MKLPQGYDAVTGEALPSLSATGMPWAGVLEARSALRGKAAPDLQKSPPFPCRFVGCTRGRMCKSCLTKAPEVVILKMTRFLHCLLRKYITTEVWT